MTTTTNPPGLYVKRDLRRDLPEHIRKMLPPSDDLSVEIFDRRGISDIESPLPPRWHRCFVQTYGWIKYFTLVERCPCGAICYDHRGGERSHVWIHRNSRRRES